MPLWVRPHCIPVIRSADTPSTASVHPEAWPYISVIGAELEVLIQPEYCSTIWSLHAVLHSAEMSSARVLGPGWICAVPNQSL